MTNIRPPKRISDFLSIILVVGYVLIAVTCTFLQIKSPVFTEYTMIVTVVCGFYYTDTDKRKGDKDEGGNHT